ncbi:MAG: thiamine-phosphate kinase [Candidatus Latescibacteria bacterium]|nr:thiamine-phosphate kinase [Candidatus Latescibacterota bacterium]
MTLKAYGEFDLIQRIRERIQGDDPDLVIGPGDDTAAVRHTPGSLSLLSTDTFVEGLDFLEEFSSWHQIGWKCMAANVSDIAAMAGRPRFALVSMCLPDETEIVAVDHLCDGMVDLARQYGVLIIGGDLSGTPGPLTISITIMGEVAPNQVIRRSGAEAGDRICVTGELGGAEAGLRLLQASTDEPLNGILPDDYANVLSRHRTPRPRTEEGRIIADSGCVGAMIDISDGLSADILHIGKESGVGIALDASRLPLNTAAARTASLLEIDPISLAMNSGEEFELVCTVSRAQADTLCQKVYDETGTRMSVIGEVVPQALGNTWLHGNTTHQLNAGGYDHFRK